jgi:hypothetical protein
MGTGVLSRGYSGRGMKFTTHIHLVPRFWMSGAINLLPLLPSWCKQGQIYFDFDYFLVSNFFDGFPPPGKNSLYSLNVQVQWGLSERLHLFENFVIISKLQSTKNNIYLTNLLKSDGGQIRALWWMRQQSFAVASLLANWCVWSSALVQEENISLICSSRSQSRGSEVFAEQQAMPWKLPLFLHSQFPRKSHCPCLQRQLT